jgi:hypothetical protein
LPELVGHKHTEPARSMSPTIGACWSKINALNIAVQGGVAVNNRVFTGDFITILRFSFLQKLFVSSDCVFEGLDYKPFEDVISCVK